MGLQSALSTALTGMTAAETTIDVVGNNVANANTVGFKESSVSFATQFLQTQSIGSAPTDSRGGTNPRQIGLGTKVAEITPDFTQGTVEISSNPLDLAIQGDGFFIVQGPQGEQLYTRNGQFKTNSNNEIVTLTGHRVMGYSVDSNFTIQPTGLVPIQIPLGAAAVAQATENVHLKGALNPSQEQLGTRPEIIQSGVLSDGRRAVPSDTTQETRLSRPLNTTTPSLGAGAGNIDPGTYRYKITFLDDQLLNETPASVETITVNVAAAGSEIDLSGIPTPPAGFTRMRIYRADSNAADPNEFREVFTGAAATTRTDDVNDSAVGPALDDTGLDSGSYSYYVTFYNSTSGEESRPTSVIGPVTADETNGPRIFLDQLPIPSGDPLTGGYNGIRIYRNLANDPDSFYQVADLNPTTIATYVSAGDPVSFVDSMPDEDAVSQPEINLEGPAISFDTPLTEVFSRTGSNYERLFEVGELSFAGDKGGRQLGARTLNITTTTTVADLLDFMEQSMGILEGAVEDTFPSAGYGGTALNGRLQFTSNMGIENALSIDLSAFRMTPTATGVAETLQLPFTSIQDANGKGATADFVVYDSLGTPLNVRMTTVLEEVSPAGAKFRWIATSADNLPDSGNSTVVGTGVITTDSDGKFVSASNDRVAIQLGNSPAASPLEFAVDFAKVTGLSPQNPDAASTLSAASQDGFPAGTLTSFIITDTGRIQGVFSNGSSRDLGQLRMATFANNGGLQQIGDNLFETGVNSGLPIEGDPGSQGIGAITAGAVELSNTDIGQNLIELILASTQYRGGARVITAVQQLLDELMALRR
jgi:flagellar hook protein FlgE